MDVSTRAAALAMTVWLVAGAAPVRAGEVRGLTPLQRDGRIYVSFEFIAAFTPEIEAAVRSGLPTSFAYRIEIRRGSAIWFDRTIEQSTLVTTVRYDNLTRRYRLSRAIDGAIIESAVSEQADVMRHWMTSFERVPLFPMTALEPNGEYYLRVRAHARAGATAFLFPWDRESVVARAPFTYVP